MSFVLALRHLHYRVKTYVLCVSLSLVSGQRTYIYICVFAALDRDRIDLGRRTGETRDNPLLCPCL